MEDLKYIEKAKLGDREALDYIVSKWQPKLMAFFLKKNAGSYAEDLAQDVLIKVIQKIDTLREANAFNGWIGRIALNELNNHFRTGNSLKFQDLEDEHLEEIEVFNSGVRQGRNGISQINGVNDETMNKVFENENVAIVREALDKLPDLYSKRSYGEAVQYVLTRFFEGDKMKEISEDMNFPIGTVKRMIHYAKKKLETLLPVED